MKENESLNHKTRPEMKLDICLNLLNFLDFVVTDFEFHFFFLEIMFCLVFQKIGKRREKNFQSAEMRGK